MQFLMLIKIANTSDYEAGTPLPGELDRAMGELMGQWSQSGAFVSAAGLRPTSQGARVRSSGGAAKVIDGPFTESKEVVGGFFLLEASDKAAAVEMARRFVQLHIDTLGPEFHLECEVRQLDA